MKNDELRPDPNTILTALKQQETKDKGGKLYIFLGMSPGVGKTYAMLEHAHTALENGEDLLIAIAETHGRTETAELLEGLPVLPAKQVEYKGKIFQELDLHAVLTRKPKIVVIDELAHTNMPGLAHEKRWQDVEEILNNGIDVYTTINIQHVESRKEDVELITAVTIHETVPDTLFERAQQIELIDLPPAQLIERLKEGKVYLGGDNISLAANNFFKTNKLTALREIALRFAGDVVGSELDALNMGVTPASTKSKILILLLPDTETKKIIRAARKVSFASNGELYAMVVDRNNDLSRAQKQMLTDNIELARHMDAEIINTADTDIITVVKQAIKKLGITRIILPKSQRNTFKDLFWGGSLVTRLLNETEIDVHIIRNTNFFNPSKLSLKKYLYIEKDLNKYLKVLLALVLVTAFNVLIYRFSGYQSVGFIYLLLVLFTGAISTMGPIMFSAIGSVIAWNFFFIPPIFTAHISTQEDIVMCLVFLLTALVTGLRTNKILQNQNLLREREARTNILLEITKAINSNMSKSNIFKEISKQLRRVLNGNFIFTFKNVQGEFETYNSHQWYSWISSEKEFSVAMWTMKNDTMAGWNTDTLSLSEALYLPLTAKEGPVGFLSYMPKDYKTPLSFDELTLLKAAADQAAVFLGKELLKESTEKLKHLEEAQKIYQVVLNTISHELKTPLTIINGSVDILAGSGGKDISSLEDLKEASYRLNREINNILDMSRLSSDMTVKREWNDLTDIVSSSVEKLKSYTAGRVIDINIEKDLPFVRANFALFESLISNLIINAVKYTPGLIKLNARAKGSLIFIEVEDEGPGVEESELNSIFDKFYRAKNAGSNPGIGIGLSIARSVVQLHEGSIGAENLNPKGFKVTVELPLEEQPKI